MVYDFHRQIHFINQLNFTLIPLQHLITFQSPYLSISVLKQYGKMTSLAKIIINCFKFIKIHQLKFMWDQYVWMNDTIFAKHKFHCLKKMFCCHMCEYSLLNSIMTIFLKNHLKMLMEKFTDATKWNCIPNETFFSFMSLLLDIYLH